MRCRHLLARNVNRPGEVLCFVASDSPDDIVRNRVQTFQREVRQSKLFTCTLAHSSPLNERKDGNSFVPGQLP
jgi:hypothetical protein